MEEDLKSKSNRVRSLPYGTIQSDSRGERNQ